MTMQYVAHFEKYQYIPIYKNHYHLYEKISSNTYLRLQTTENREEKLSKFFENYCEILYQSQGSFM